MLFAMKTGTGNNGNGNDNDSNKDGDEFLLPGVNFMQRPAMNHVSAWVQSGSNSLAIARIIHSVALLYYSLGSNRGSQCTMMTGP